MLGAAWSGGRVEKMVLHPLTISRTDLAENPHPWLVAWAGPILGAVLPLATWWAASHFGMPGTFVIRFFAGFCLIANGAYLGVGSFDRVGDAGDLIGCGVSPWVLRAFGVVAASAGLWMWHRQGRHFGLGPHASTVRPGAAYACLGALVLLVALELLASG